MLTLLSEIPSLREIATLLRAPGRWPDDFTWDYTQSDRCAMGLAERIYVGFNIRSFIKLNFPPGKEGLEQFGQLFMGLHYFDNFPMEFASKNLQQVSPLYLADQIDDYLTTAKQEKLHAVRSR